MPWPPALHRSQPHSAAQQCITSIREQAAAAARWRATRRRKTHVPTSDISSKTASATSRIAAPRLTGRMKSLVSRRKGSRRRARRARALRKWAAMSMHPGRVDVSASGGTVTLSGSILAHEHEELMEAVSTVPGVTDIVDRIGVYEKAEGHLGAARRAPGDPLAKPATTGRRARASSAARRERRSPLRARPQQSVRRLRHARDRHRDAGSVPRRTNRSCLLHATQGQVPTLSEPRYQSTRRVSSMIAASTPNTSSAPRRRL